MSQGEVALIAAARNHREGNAPHAGAHQRADLEDLEADRAAGRFGPLRVLCRAMRRSTQAIEANDKRSWLPRIVAAEVRSANTAVGKSLAAAGAALIAASAPGSLTLQFGNIRLGLEYRSMKATVIAAAA